MLKKNSGRQSPNIHAHQCPRNAVWNGYIRAGYCLDPKSMARWQPICQCTSIIISRRRNRKAMMLTILRTLLMLVWEVRLGVKVWSRSRTVQHCVPVWVATPGIGLWANPTDCSLAPYRKTHWSRTRVSLNPTVSNVDRFCSQNL